MPFTVELWSRCGDRQCDLEVDSDVKDGESVFYDDQILKHMVGKTITKAYRKYENRIVIELDNVGCQG